MKASLGYARRYRFLLTPDPRLLYPRKFTMQDRILDALRAQGIAPKTTLRGTVVSLRTGPQKHSATLDLGALEAALPDGEPRAVAHNAARGILAVINEPKNSDADTWSFIDCTPVIAPCAEGPGFLEGVRAAGGDAPFFQPYVGDLKLAYYVDLDDGQRLLTEAQVEAWGVHPERIQKAGMSILFYRSGYERWQNQVVDGTLIRRLAIGDGGDAARGSLLELFDFQKAQQGRLFAMPSQGSLVFTDVVSKEAYDVLQRVVNGAFEKAQDPLSTKIFKIQNGTLEPTPLTEAPNGAE